MATGPLHAGRRLRRHVLRPARRLVHGDAYPVDEHDSQRDPKAAEARLEPRLDPGEMVRVQWVGPGQMTVRLLRNISRTGFSIVTDRPAPSDVTAHFEFSTASRLSITVPARMVHSRSLDPEGRWHVSGWQFSSNADVKEAVATIIEYLVIHLGID